MDVALRVLGSGSGGNGSLLRLGDEYLMIDMGFGPRSTASRLSGSGVQLDQIKHAILTHLDRDHFRPSWFRSILKHRINVHCHERHVHALYRNIAAHSADQHANILRRENLLHVFGDNALSIPFTQTTLSIHHIPLAHDENGTRGFIIHADEYRIAYATDLGHVPDTLVTGFTDCDLIALECNYDRQLQLESDRPQVLIRRVMGKAGHLSNDQSFAALQAIFARSTHRYPQHVVLLHLSRDCNQPRIVTDLFKSNRAISERLHLSCQDQPTPWLKLTTAANACTGDQMLLFG